MTTSMANKKGMSSLPPALRKNAEALKAGKSLAKGRKGGSPQTTKKTTTAKKKV